MNIRTLCAALAALLLVVVGCGDDTVAPSTTGTISGKVTHEFDGTPVSGVVVTVQETADKATTDAQGNYTISNVAPGSYNVNAVKTGFETTFTETDVVVGKTSTLNILMSPPLPSGKSRITGRVYNEDGFPVAGATIRTEPETMTATSDADGYYRLVPIDMEFYDVIASKAGSFSDSANGDTRFTSTADSVNFVLRDSVPSKGLTAYFKFDGNANNAVAGGGNGTGTATVATADRFGNAASALGFNGTSSFVSVPSSDALNLGGATGSFTISLWIKVDGLQQTNAGIMIKGEEDSFYNLTRGYRLYAGANAPAGSPFLALFTLKGQGNSSYEIASETSSFWLSGAWRHIVIVYDRTAQRVRRYSGGNPLLGGTLSSTDQDFTTTAPLLFGKNSRGDKFFKGAIDDVRIYNRALTDDQVNNLYHERGY